MIQIDSSLVYATVKLHSPSLQRLVECHMKEHPKLKRGPMGVDCDKNLMWMGLHQFGTEMITNKSKDDDKMPYS